MKVQDFLKPGVTLYTVYLVTSDIVPLDEPSSSRPDTSRKVRNHPAKLKVVKKLVPVQGRLKEKKKDCSDLDSIDFEERHSAESYSKVKNKALKKNIKKIKIEKESDSDLESINSFTSDKSDDLRFGVESIFTVDEDEKDTLEPEIKPKAWVIVSYAIKQKKRHFVGEVLSTYGSPVPDTCDIRFLRKVPGSTNVFQWPELCDEDLNVPFSDIIAVLNEPKLDRRGLLSFSHKFDGLDIQ